MATVYSPSSADTSTLFDVSRRSGGRIQKIVELMSKSNDALDDIPWSECNSGVVHKTTLRTSIPTPVWRMLNSGVPNGKSTTKQATYTCGMLEIYAEVDKAQVVLAANGQVDDASSNAAASNAIAKENEAFIEGFNQEISRVMFYGDPAHPQEPVGFTHFYNDGTGETQKNILNGGGSVNGQNTSIWLVCWGDRSVHGLYPRGTSAGLSEKFLGEVTLFDSEGQKYQGYRTHYQWYAGFAIEDPRCLVRIANIDVNNLITGGTGAADLIDLMMSAIYRLPKEARGYRKAFYCRPEVMEILDKQTRKEVKYQLGYGDVFGRRVLTFRDGIPVREQEALLDTEDVVRFNA